MSRAEKTQRLSETTRRCLAEQTALCAEAEGERAAPICARPTALLDEDVRDLEYAIERLVVAVAAAETAFARAPFGTAPPWLQDLWEPVVYELARRALDELARGVCPPGVSRGPLHRAIRELEVFHTDWLCTTRAPYPTSTADAARS